MWTLVGVLASTATGTETFLRNWLLLQGSPLIAVGIFLSLFGRGRRIEELSEKLHCPAATVRFGRRTRHAIIVLVTIVGTGSLSALGFPARQPVLGYMWLTCFLICLMAALATVHAGEILLFASRLPACTGNLHPYSPADTPAIRKAAEYIAFFGLVVSIGYSFAFVGTVSGNWTADQSLVQVVEYFWPLIYVPLCLATLLYPHVAIYRLIRSEKDNVISGLQEKMLALSSAGHNLGSEDIDRLNALADLVHKIESTPNYPRNVSLIGSLSLTLAANIASLVIPREALTQALRSAIGF